MSQEFTCQNGVEDPVLNEEYLQKTDSHFSCQSPATLVAAPTLIPSGLLRQT